ncbi:MAG: serine hydrolase domain-containing protein [Bacteroidia bacterium]
MKKILVLLSVLASATTFTSCNRAPDLVPPTVVPSTPVTTTLGTAVDNFIKTRMQTANVPGLSFAAIKKGQLVAMQGYGFAYQKAVNGVVTDVPVDKNTTFLMGSLTKAVVTMAAAQLEERTDLSFELDADVNLYLPFSVRNPNYPNVPITTRMLLAESSTIIDNANIKDAYVYSTMPLNADASDKMEDFLKAHFDVANPSLNANFINMLPGQNQEPSRIGIALASLVVEKVSRLNINEYSKSFIFTKLGTYDASFLLSELKTENMALPYDYDAPSIPAVYTPLSHYGTPYYGGGQLRTSPQQMARLLMAFMNDGKYGTATLISDSTAKDLRKVAFPGISSNYVTGMVYKLVGVHNLLGIETSEAGLTNRFYYEPLTGNGVIVVTNCGDFNVAGANYIPVNTEIDAIVEHLFDVL